MSLFVPPRFSPWLITVVLSMLFGTSRAVAAPANDMFATPTSITSAALPYSELVDITQATNEFNEPFYCTYSNQTVWYRFAPSSNTWIRASAKMTGYYAAVTLYRDYGGGGFGGLSFLRCTTDSTVYLAEAGATYYLQVMVGCCSVPGTLQFDLAEITPPSPVAQFYTYPSDPSVYDTVAFQDLSFDPAGLSINSWSWDFGDGAHATGCCPTHRYAADGGYAVTLTVQTTDGRTGTTTQSDSVKTHDVGITGFKTPQTASAGQTKAITVSVRNTRYPESVRVTLEKSIVGGFTTIGYQDQFLPVRLNRSTDVGFSYVFTADDAQIGKVTFRATVQVNQGHDALPADNVAISLPTKVGKFGAIAATEGDLQATDEMELALLSVTPNPASVGVDLAVRLALPASGSARLQVVDLAGRVWTQRDLDDLGPGVHDTKVAWQRKPPPGIYWIRLIQQGAAVSRRVALIH